MVALGRETIIILWFLLIWLFPFIEGSFGNENQKINFYGMEVKLLEYQVSAVNNLMFENKEMISIFL